jgi:hypothetical protein
VFNTVTVDKLMSLVGLGDDREAVMLAGAVDGFFSYFEFTKLTTAAVVADAVSRGVMEGRLGYAPSVEITSEGVRVGNPDSVRLSEMVPTSEIELSGASAILTPRLAEAVRSTRGTAEQAIVVVGESGATPGIVVPSGPTVEGVPERTQPAPGERLGSLRLRLRITGDQWFPLQRAISSLRELAGSIEAEIELHADGGSAGMDPAQLRNGVLEPLEEAGIEVDQERR